MKKANLPIKLLFGALVTTVAVLVAFAGGRPGSSIPNAPLSANNSSASPVALAAAPTDPRLQGYTPSQFPGVYVRHMPGDGGAAAGAASMAALPGARLSAYQGNGKVRPRAVLSTLPNGVRKAHVGTGFMTNETADFGSR